SRFQGVAHRLFDDLEFLRCECGHCSRCSRKDRAVAFLVALAAATGTRLIASDIDFRSTLKLVRACPAVSWRTASPPEARSATAASARIRPAGEPRSHARA